MAKRTFWSVSAAARIGRSLPMSCSCSVMVLVLTTVRSPLAAAQRSAGTRYASDLPTPVPASSMPMPPLVYRPAMVAAIAGLYTKGGIGMLEAGTGVGKSLAYLVPALRWAAANGERTVVSTNTITLQEQLIGKDLPILAAALTDQKVRFAMLKGWHNYLCKLRLETARAEGASLFEDSMADEFHALDAWAAKTKDGSLADLALQPRSEVWDEVAAEGDLCPRMRCPHFDSCFVFTARRRAAEADVVVVNHHLLMADVAVRRASGNWSEAAVLPPFTRLVIDEGHHLEAAAAAHLGHTVS